jgi:hypothetical protein
MRLLKHRHEALRVATVRCLKQCGIKPVKSGSYSYECPAVTPTEAASQLKAVLDLLANPRASQYRGELDSLLIYIDRAKD